MKKLVYIFAATVGMMLGSCGGSTQQNVAGEDSIQVAVFADSVVAQLDSLAHIICEISDTTDLSQLVSPERLSLTADQKLVRPDYLITSSDIDELITLQQKYVALAYLSIDNSVQQLYYGEDADDEYYSTAMSRLAAETDATNEKLSQEAANAPFTMGSAMKFYEDMKQRNRLDKFYVAEAAYIVEFLYIISRNTDLYMQSINDETAARITRMISTILSGEEIIAASNPEVQPVVDALAPIRDINATTSAQLKQQLENLNETLEVTRKALLNS